MIFANPLGLLALLAIPAIVGIHLFRRRFPQRPVAGLFLWHLTRQTPEGGGRITKLPITASLLLECLAALALALILAGARLSTAAVTPHLVVLLDDSASMAAVNGRGESARDRAVRRVLDEVDRLGAGARVTIVASGERPSVLAGPAALAVETRAALERWRPQAAHHSLALGIRLARELADDRGALLVLSDLSAAARGDGDVARALWVSVGEPLANVGITAAERTLSPDDARGTVLLTLANHGDQAARRRVTVSAAGKDVLARDLDVPVGVSSLSLPLPPGLPPVRVLLSDDPLRRDNEVILAEPRPRVVGVANRLRDGRGRDALQRALGAVAGVTASDAPHLVFVEASDMDRPSPPGVWRAAFGAPSGDRRAAGEAEDFVGPFVMEKRHPLLHGVTLGGVVWAGAAPVSPAAVRPLATAGDRALIGLVPSAAASGDPTMLFNVDLDRTNLIRAPDWPILISNLVEMRRQNLSGPERWNYRIGEWVRVKLENDPKGALRVRGGGTARTLPGGRQLEFLAPSPGGLLEVLDGDTVLFELGVNFLDDIESNVRRQTSSESGERVDAAPLRAESGQASDPLFWVLLGTGALAIVSNWWLLSPRRSHA